jgi:hypothetical protein
MASAPDWPIGGQSGVFNGGMDKSTGGDSVKRSDGLERGITVAVPEEITTRDGGVAATAANDTNDNNANAKDIIGNQLFYTVAAGSK